MENSCCYSIANQYIKQLHIRGNNCYTVVIPLQINILNNVAKIIMQNGYVVIPLQINILNNIFDWKENK